MLKTSEDSVRDAFARSRARLALVHDAGRTPAGYDVFVVGSSASVDAAYRVTVDPAGEFTCTCPSELRAACWHRAAVAIRRANDRARAEHEARRREAGRARLAELQTILGG